MQKVLIWGIGAYYDKYVRPIMIREKEVCILGFITGIKTTCTKLDGVTIYDPFEIVDLDFDYVIIASQVNYKIIEEKLTKELKISPAKCINGIVFRHPCFDWNRYIKILKSHPTIVTEACYGGYLYHELGLPFLSPFINTRIEEKDYLRLIGDLNYYLSQDIKLYRSNDLAVEEMEINYVSPEISWGKMGYPIFDLGGVKLHAIHARNEQEYLEQWKRRKERINKDNIWVFMILENDEAVEEFEKIEMMNKIGFTFTKEGKNLAKIYEWGDYQCRLKADHSFLSYIHHSIWDDSWLRSIDIFKMLCGEEDFIRIS